MQHLEGSGTPVLYMGRTVLKGKSHLIPTMEVSGNLLCTFLTPSWSSLLATGTKYSNGDPCNENQLDALFIISLFRGDPREYQEKKELKI